MTAIEKRAQTVSEEVQVQQVFHFDATVKEAASQQGDICADPYDISKSCAGDIANGTTYNIVKDSITIANGVGELEPKQVYLSKPQITLVQYSPTKTVQEKN